MLHLGVGNPDWETEADRCAENQLLFLFFDPSSAGEGVHFQAPRQRQLVPPLSRSG